MKRFLSGEVQGKREIIVVLIKRSPFAQKSGQKRRFDARRKKNKKKNSKIAPKIQIKS